MMEIPIQVAVRIFPVGAAKFVRTSQKEDANGNSNSSGVENEGTEAENWEHVDDDANGNVIVANGVAEEDKKALSKVVTDTEEQESATRCCVQTIPMAASVPAFLNNTPTALPGLMLENGIAAGLVQVGPHTFPVTHALHIDCTQSQIYHQTVFPLISLFLEGFDASVVMYGQCGTGKSYTLFGHGFDCAYGEADQGVVQRSVREIYAHLANHPERTYAVNIGWMEICGETIRDLLGIGNVSCRNVTDVFHWLQVGMSTQAVRAVKAVDAPAVHTLFTVTLEQQWVSKEGLIQHRLSTASFSDLCDTERLFMLNSLEQPTSLPKDLGLQSLEQVVNTLTDPALLYGFNGNVPYNQTTLTTLLKDSFGGRAQTLIILCVSPLECNINETICNMQFAFKVQCVRNFVIMNTFSDDNTPFSPDAVLPELLSSAVGLSGGCLPSSATDSFGLQFAASQWFKLVSNAEGLFSKLVTSNAISDLDKEQIEEWLFLKQECEECLSSSEVLRSQKQLVPIQEAEEPEETLSEPDTSCQQNSDNESDSESQRPDLVDKLEILMDELSHKTDTLVKGKYKEFMEQQPKAVMESQESYKQKQAEQCADKGDERKASVGGRRRSIQPGAILSSAEIAMLNRVASREQQAAAVATAKSPDDFLDSSGDLEAAKLRAAQNSPVEQIQRKLRKLDTEIEAHQRQIKEVEQTMQLKQNIITDLVKNSDTRSTAKQRFNKKKAKLEAEYEKTKKQLARALVQGKADKSDVERLRVLMAHLEQRLQDLTSIKHIAGESGQKVKKLQQSLHESKKLVEDLQKKLKKEKKMREQLDAELKALKEKEHNKTLVKLQLVGDGDVVADELKGVGVRNEERGKHLQEVQARISHLDHVLREKSENLEQCGDDGSSEQKEGLRHEIRNLRRTRDHLLETRCSLDRKLKREKSLSQREERKLLECDEAIEAIDAAIEFKNELICGHKSIDTSERVQREKGEQMLMARLNKLSPEEMRTLLYKYFTKVIDLRDSSRKLEVQLLQLERERDAWEWKERVLSNAVRQARLEGERNAVLLQRQHEMKLTLMLRHLAEETSASTSSASYSDQQQQQRYMRSNHLALAPHHHHAHHAYLPTATTNSSQFSDSDFELNFYKNAMHTHKMLKAPRHSEMEICPLPDSLTKYKPLDKYKERETKNKLLAKFQVLTRYAGQSISTTTVAAGEHGNGHAAGGSSSKKKDREQFNNAAIPIPQQQLKRLMAAPPATKVTRQKNKIIIQDASRKN